MAVRVVSKEPVKTYKIVCAQCCYQLEYTPIDIQYDDDGRKFIRCPREICNYRNMIDKMEE